MANIDNPVLDDPLVSSGDAAFAGGMVSATPAQQLSPGQYAYGLNVDHDNFGRIMTRRGAQSTTGATASALWEAETSTWNGSSKYWGNPLGTTKIDALAYFETYAAKYALAAQGGSLYQGTESAPFAAIASASYSGTRVYFAQLNNRMYYCDGVGALKYIDSSVTHNSITAGKVSSIKVTTQGVGYTSVPAITFSSGAATATAVLGYGGRVISATVTSASSGYSATTPPTISFAAAPSGGVTAAGVVNITQVPSKPAYLVSHTNRLFATSADTAIPPDTIYISDLLDGESWDLAGASIRVGGDGDAITGLYPWFSNYLLVFKQRSIWMVDCDPLVAVANWDIKLINNRIGCVSDRSIQAVGKDVFFLAQDGVRKLSSIEQGTQTDVSAPVSAPVQDQIDGINRSLQSQACSAFYRNRYFLSIPTGAGTTNSTTLVYNALLGAWSGVWTGWAPWQYVITAFSGRVRLNFADNSGAYWTWDDYTSPTDERSSNFRDGSTEIESYVITRAYDMGDPLVDKTGYMVEFITENTLPDAAVTAYAYYDKDQSGSFTSLSTSLNLPVSTKRTRRNFNLIPKGKWSTIQFKYGATRYRSSLSGLAVTGFSDAIKPELS